MRIPARVLAWIQGAYFALTGLWPLVHMPSFLAVTGPKTDLWLVQTVGVLVLVVGLVLLLAARRDAAATPEMRTLAMGTALGLAAIDVIFTSTGTLRAVYLLDAIPEVVLAAFWGLARRDETGERKAAGKRARPLA